MRTGAAALAAALALIACAPVATPPPGDRRIVILAVDGATWNIASPLLSAGRMPNLARLYRSGSAGLMRSMEPMDPAALWTTVATGKPPGAHGVRAVAEKMPGRYAMAPVTADRRRSVALWTILGSRGLAVGVPGWEGTFPVEALNGFMLAPGLPEGAGEKRGYVHPAGALGQDGRGEAIVLSGRAARTAALDPPIADAMTGDLAMLSRGLSLYRVYRPRVAFLRLRSIDAVSHRYWQGPERGAPSPLSGAIPGVYEFVDDCIGLLLERLEAGTTLIILSSHGFRQAEEADVTAIDMNGLLERLGYLRRNAAGETDWSRTRVFNLQDAASDRRGLYLNLTGRESRGIVNPSEAGALVLEVMASLEGLRTGGGERLFRAVLDARNASGEGPDIEVITRKDADRSAGLALQGERVRLGELYHRTSEHSGAHDPSGIILATGPGIARGRTNWGADLLDVFPTVLYLLGLPLPEDIPGGPIEQVLTEAPGEDHPTVTSFGDLPAAPPPLFRAPEEFQARLRAERDLGHIR